MRSQGCTIQQALTTEAAAVVKQAVALAKRRGHAQVTPLHVAHTMLSVSSGLLRAACLQSHSHPLQCRALELCFNVALNRLPTSTSGPMLGPHSAQHHHPTIANALVAAFKRAQAHQRRGSIENQQQPLLAVKIELEQLIISILDDPSVSRVMREAGLSSTLVKGKVEQAVSVETPNNDTNTNNNNNNIIKPKDSNNSNNNNSSCNNNIINTSNSNSFLSMAQTGSLKVGKPRLCDNQGVEKNSEDVVSVIDSLVNKRKRNSVVVVGECLSTLEGLVRGVMDRVEKGEVPEALKEVKFIHLSFASFGHLSKDEVEQRVGELKCLVKLCCMDNNKGVILYLDDLKWVNEFRASNNNILVDQHQPRRSCYCPIEHMIIEIGKLALAYAGESGKLWLLGIATFQTYMRCKGGQSSLESLWGLQAITIPAGSLGLSLLPESDLQSPLSSKKLDMNGISSWLMLESGGGVDSYRASGTVNMESQSRQSSACNSDSTNSSLPSWLQQYKDENSKKASNITNNDQDSVPVKDLCKRWGSICTSSSPSFERTLSFSSISPSSSTSNFSYDPQHSRLQPTHQSFEPKNFWVTETSNRSHEPPTSFTMSMSPNDHLQRRHTTPTAFISSNPNSTPTSTSSSDIMDPLVESQCVRFKEYTTENLKILCNAVEQEVPRQKDIIMDIVSTILHCRSGKSRRKSNEQNNKEETWLFFQGIDIEAKEKIARELARLIFGSSQDKFISIGLSSFSSTRVVDSLEESRNKRLRDEQSCSYTERFAEAVSNDPHRVFFVEDIEQVDYCSQMGIKKAIERGKICKHSSGEEVSFGDAIIIFSCERFSSRSRACSPSMKHKVDVMPQEDDHEMKNMEDSACLDDTTSSPSLSLDLNISINDDDDDNEITEVENPYSMDEIGLLATVDKCIVFKSHQEL
ncbi:protein SMAX1-LIKE 3-like [Chenopodium quinoa]|uniref:protein SMAX1-LIKE 3-like n=1 Tax=Chenopodium quinoa TaxID=63459 RepID=UPI000B792BDC|nr:protein SMAX1-LIKE 3-like [Chenopodium quinoa]